MKQLICESIFHKSIDGIELARLREAAGMNQAEFGKLVGVELNRVSGLSQQYIQQLERPGLWEITSEMADAIKEVLKQPLAVSR